MTESVWRGHGFHSPLRGAACVILAASISYGPAGPVVYQVRNYWAQLQIKLLLNTGVMQATSCP